MLEDYKQQLDDIRAEMLKCEQALRKIQLKHWNYDAGYRCNDGTWQKYYPHRSTVRSRQKITDVGHHNEWCDCIHCHKQHERYFELNSLGLKIHDEARKAAGGFPFSRNPLGKSIGKCFICGQPCDNNTILHMSKENAIEASKWFKNTHVNLTRYANSGGLYIYVCDQHEKDYYHLFADIIWYNALHKEVIDNFYKEVNKDV